MMLTIVHVYLIHTIGYCHGDAQTRAPTVIISIKILVMIFHVALSHTPVHDAASSVCVCVCVCGVEIVVHF
jgi:hypothetical protein